MNHYVLRILIAILFSACTLSAHAKEECLEGLRNADQQRMAIATSVGRQSAAGAEEILAREGVALSSRKGYAILVGTMIGSAVLTTTISAHLPADFQFASVFVTQVTTLGVYVLGAPIWEPLTSKFRKWAFGLNQSAGSSGSASPQLEATWVRTQESYSLNAQMSRNVVGQFILGVKDNFYQAYRAHVERNPVYSADQVAEAAFRMRVLFKDIDPADRSVAAAVLTAFTSHVQMDESFGALVSARLQNLDSEWERADVSAYYQTLFATWLGSAAPAASLSK